jgi:hypothetical protein
MPCARVGATRTSLHEPGDLSVCFVSETIEFRRISAVKKMWRWKGVYGATMTGQPSGGGVPAASVTLFVTYFRGRSIYLRTRYGVANLLDQQVRDLNRLLVKFVGRSGIALSVCALCQRSGDCMAWFPCSLRQQQQQQQQQQQRLQIHLQPGPNPSSSPAVRSSQTTCHTDSRIR